MTTDDLKAAAQTAPKTGSWFSGGAAKLIEPPSIGATQAQPTLPSRARVEKEPRTNRGSSVSQPVDGELGPVRDRVGARTPAGHRDRMHAQEPRQSPPGEVAGFTKGAEFVGGQARISQAEPCSAGPADSPMIPQLQ